MRHGAVISAVFHTTIFVLLMVGLPRFQSSEILDSSIAVEVVTLDVETPLPKPEPKPEPEPTAEEKAPVPEPPKQEAKPAPVPEPPPPPEPVEPEPVVKAEAVPIPQPEPTPTPEVKPEPKKVVKPPPPKPRPKPEVKVAMEKKPEKKPEKKVDRLTSILRNVEKLKEQPQPQTKQTAKAEKQAPPRVASALQQSEMERLIQQQMARCWRVEPGAQQAEDLIIKIRVTLNPDGSLRSAEILDVDRMFGDAYFRSAAENARRAILTCSPFELPVKQYDVWQAMTLRFNPREMFGS